MAYVSRTKKAQAQAKVTSPVESPVKQTTNEVHVSATTSLETLETLETIREDLAEIKNDLKKNCDRGQTGDSGQYDNKEAFTAKQQRT